MELANQTNFERTFSRKVKCCTASQSPEDIGKQQLQICRKQCATHGKTRSLLFSEKDRKQNASCAEGCTDQDAICAERSTNQDARYAHRRMEERMLAVLREVQTRRREKVQFIQKFFMCFCLQHACSSQTYYICQSSDHFSPGKYCLQSYGLKVQEVCFSKIFSLKFVYYMPK